MKLTFLNAHLQWIPEYPLSSVALRVRTDSTEIICDGGWGSDDQIVHFQREIQLRDDVYVGGQFSFHVDLVALLNETGSESRTIGSGVCTLFSEDTNERTRMIALMNTKMKIIMAQLLVRLTPQSLLAEGQSDVEIPSQTDELSTLPVMDIAHEGKYLEAEKEKEKSFSFSMSRASCLTTQPTMKIQKKSTPVPSNADANFKLGVGKDSCRFDVPTAQGEVDSDNVEINPPLERTVKSTAVKNESYRLSIEDVREPSRMLQGNTFQAMQAISEKVLRSDHKLEDGVDAERNTLKKSALIPPDPLELGSSSESDSASVVRMRKKNSESLKSAGKHMKSDNILNNSQQLKVTEACQRVKAVIQKNNTSNEKRKSGLTQKKSVNKSPTRKVHQSDNLRTRPKEEIEFAGSSDPIFNMQNRLRAAEKRRAQILHNTKEKARQLALKDSIKSEAIKEAILISSLEFNKLRNKFDKRNSILDREQAAQEAKFRCDRGRRNVRTYSVNRGHDAYGDVERSRSFDAVPPAVVARTSGRNNYREADRLASTSEGREYERRSATAIPYSNLRLRSQSVGREREKEKYRETARVKYDDVRAEYTAAVAAEEKENVAHQTTMEHSFRAAESSRRMNHQQAQSPFDPQQPDLEGTAVEPTVRSGISKLSNRIKEPVTDTFGDYAADLTGHHNQNLLITLVLDRVEAIKSRIPTSSKADVKNMLIMIERLVTLAIALNAIVKIDTAAGGRSKKALNAVTGTDDAAVKDLCSATPLPVQPNIMQMEPKPSSNVQENTANNTLRNPSCDSERSILKPKGEGYSTFSNIATIEVVPVLKRTLDQSIPLTHAQDVVKNSAEDSFYSLESVASSSSVSSVDSLEDMSEKLSYERKRRTTNEAILASDPIRDRAVDVMESSVRENELLGKRIDMKDKGGGILERGRVGVCSNTSSSSSSDCSSSQSTGSTGSTVSSVDMLIKSNMKARSSVITRCVAPVIHHHNHSPPRSPAQRVDPFRAVNMMESLSRKCTVSRERSSGDVDLDVDAVASIGSGAGTYQWSGTGLGSEASTGSGTGDVSSDIALVSRAIDNLQVRQLQCP